MSRLPSLTGNRVVKAPERAGFAVTRTHGGHKFLTHPDGRTTTVTVHAGETIGPGLLSKILRDVELTREEFRALLD